MRLTLRTMLAYLDDILEPQDTEDIAKKIEESEFATELVHRTRDSMRRLRLGVPPLDGKGLGTDPNTVAEYLDNTLSTERVPEFERICLESDTHLAEVASCHQILTLVLGEPAEIDARSRVRMYAVPSQPAPQPIAAELVERAGAPAAGAAPPAPPRRHKPEVPEYLRESRSRLWPVAAAVLVGAALTIGALAIFGPARWREGISELAQGETSSAEPVAAPTTPLQPAVGLTPPAADGAPAAAPDSAANPAEAPAITDTPPAVDAAPPAPNVATEPSPVVAPDPDMPAEGTPPGVAPPTDPASAAASRPAEAPSVTAPAPPEPSTDAATPDSPLPAPLPDTGLPAPDATAPTEPGATAPADAAEPARDAAEASFGRYTSKREVLLKFDRESGDWKRLPAMSPLAKGDRLLSLPLFRPSIALGTNITVQPDGAALVELVGWTEAGVPILSIEYGRLLMMTVGKAGNAIQLNFGEYQTELTFVDAESTVALEASRHLVPGKDPTEVAAPLGVELYATSGSVRVRGPEGPPLDLQAPAQRTLFGSPVATAGEVPSWVTSEAHSDFESRAASTLEPLLPSERLVGLILKELAGERRREVRYLATRSAAHVGNFEPCINALMEKDERTFWPTYIEDMRDGVARSPEAAKRVRATLDKQRGADGEPLFRMLWGYSAEDLQNGAANQLVEGLNHDSLDHRVLAIWSLQDITGLPNYGYNPTDLAKVRVSRVNTWKERLRQKKIVPKDPAAATKPKSTPAKAAPKSS